MADEKVIEIRNVQKVYKKNHLFKTLKTVALNGLSLTVYRGDIYCLLGLNGSGKTTTVKLLLNLIFPSFSGFSKGVCAITASYLSIISFTFLFNSLISGRYS